MTPAELTIDPATITCAVFGAVTWLLSISFLLGRYSERQKQVESRQEKTDATVAKIFDKLDTLAKSVPHVCDKSERIVALEQIAKDRARRLESIEHWRQEEGFHASHVAEKEHDEAAGK